MHSTAVYAYLVLSDGAHLLLTWQDFFETTDLFNYTSYGKVVESYRSRLPFLHLNAYHSSHEVK